MPWRRPWWTNAAMVALGVGALAAGLVVGAGCGLCYRPCPTTPIEPGALTIVESLDRPELVGGMVELATDRVELSFVDAEGHDWVIDYTIEE